MSPFWLTLFLFVGFTVLSDLLRPKPKFGAPAPSALGDFTVPTAQEGRPIPVIFGTVKLAGPNVVWYGDLLVRPITKKVKTGLFSSDKVTTGYRYYMGLHLGLCHGEVDEIVAIRWDDRPVPFTLDDAILRPIEPSQGGWGLGGDAATPAQSVDEEVPDGNGSYMQGPFGSSFGVIGWRWSMPTPSSGSYSGWKLHVVSRKTASGTCPVDRIEVYKNSVWTGSTYPTAIWQSGELVRAEGFQGGNGAKWIADILTTDFEEYTLEFTEAEALSLSQGGISVLYATNAFGGSPSTAQEITTVWMSVPGSLQDEPIRIRINSPTQFGGEEREGGVAGVIDFYRGTLTQPADDYLRAKLGLDDIPAYRGMAHAVFKGGRLQAGTVFSRPLFVTIPGFYFGTTPYLKLNAWDLRRCPNTLGLSGDRHNIAGDANPACMIYECLTNERWGLGLQSSQIDTASFIAAGDVLANESVGLSMILDTGTTARDLINEIQRHIDAVTYTDPATGLITLRLIRADYGPGDPLLLNVDNVSEVTIGRPAWPDTRNVVKVQYIDRAGNFTPRICQARDSANVQVQGEQSVEEFEFRGISNAAHAQKRCEQLLRVLAHPLAPIEVVANRIAWRLRPGSVARLTWAPLGITDLAFRVTRISTGELGDGRIRISGVEDVFGIEGTAYAAPGASEWADPITEPADLADARLVEVPYALVEGPDRIVATLGARAAESLHLGYQVWADSEGGTDYAFTNEVRELTPAPVLAAHLTITATSLRVVSESVIATLESASLGDFAGGKNVALVGNELIAWRYISDNHDGTHSLSGLVRGVADTVPAEHGVGERVWFVTEGSGLVSLSPYVSDVTVAAKLLAFTSLGLQDLEDVDPEILTTVSRASRPYVPRNVLINGTAYPPLVGAGDITVAWSHRNRLAEWSWADGGLSSPVEAGASYNLRFYKDDDTLVRTYALAGSITSKTWTDEVGDVGYRSDRVRVELEAVVGSLVSFQIFNYTVWRNMGELSQRIDRAMIAALRRRRLGRVVTMSSEAD